MKAEHIFCFCGNFNLSDKLRCPLPTFTAFKLKHSEFKQLGCVSSLSELLFKFCRSLLGLSTLCNYSRVLPCQTSVHRLVVLDLCLSNSKCSNIFLLFHLLPEGVDQALGVFQLCAQSPHLISRLSFWLCSSSSACCSLQSWFS